jgi:hypothetical protein
MSDVTTDKLDDHLVPSPGNRELIGIKHSIAVSNGYAASGDDIVFFKAPCAMRICDASLNASASLGTSATAQLKAGSTAITAATTAGGADFEKMNVAPVDVAAGDAIQVRIGGANVTASATLSVHIVGYRL